MEGERLHRLMKRLLAIVEVEGKPDVHARQLARGIAPSFAVSDVAISAVKRKLFDRSADPPATMAKYDGLKNSPNFEAGDLDRFVTLLSKVLDDKALVVMLSQSMSKHSSSSGRATRTPSSAKPPRSARTPREETHAPDKRPSLAERSGLRTPAQRAAAGGTANTTEASLLSPVSQQRLDTFAVVGAEAEAKDAKEASMREQFAGDRVDQTVPTVPEWIKSRPFLNGCQYLGALSAKSAASTAESPFSVKKTGVQDTKLSEYPVDVQELLLVEDLLHVMMGLEGRFLQFKMERPKGKGEEPPKLSVVVDPSLDPSLADLAHRIAPMGVYYVDVMRFVDNNSLFRCGLVNHAFSASVRWLVREYLTLLAQLETQHRGGNLTLQRLWFYIQPSAQVMQILEHLTAEASQTYATGGALLNLIQQRGVKYGGDRQAQELFFHLMQQASVPYFEMLEHWIYDGEIRDPYGEFMIEERVDMRKEILSENVYDNYWSQRYTIRESQKPPMLAKVADKILRAGKYLNVIRECQLTVKNPHKAAISYTLQERNYIEKIETAYTYSSRILLDLLLDEQQLMARLRSIKHYFLIDQGDFINHFMDTAEEELAKFVQDISPQKLASLLELALRTSSANDDPYKDDLMCDLEPYTLIKHIMGIVGVNEGTPSKPAAPPGASPEASPATTTAYSSLTGMDLFTLSYKVQWPLSLVISKKVLVKYQLIFRHLFHCKDVERQLCNTWLNHQEMKHFHLRKAFVQSYALQQRMLHFLQNVQHYMMNEVLEPRWHQMEKKIQQAASIDDVLQHHNEFLDACFKECMLRNPRLLKILTKLMSICNAFAKHISLVHKDLCPPHPEGEAIEVSKTSLRERFAARQEHQRSGTQRAKKVMEDKGFVGTITKLEKSFDQTLHYLIQALKRFSQSECDPYLSNLCARLDYNGFYEARFFHEGR